MALERTTDAATEPISTAQAKKQLEIASAVTDHDTHIDLLVTTARQNLERFWGLALINQTWRWTLDCFPPTDELIVPRPPLSSVTSIVYTDTNGTSQTWSSSLYTVDTRSRPGRITPAYNQIWPTDVRSHINVITITYVAGFGSAASDVPEEYKHAIKLVVTDLFENRGTELVGSIRTSLDTYRYVRSLTNGYMKQAFVLR